MVILLFYQRHTHMYSPFSGDRRSAMRGRKACLPVGRGFTLIELLVVIAIIGLLASIILVSLNSARSKAKDTRVISDVRQVRSQIETEVSANGAFTVGASSCITANPAAANGAATINTINPPTANGNNCSPLNTDAQNNNGSNAIVVRSDTAVGTSATTFRAFVVYAALNGSNGYFCMDSTGQAKVLAAAPAAGIICQ